MKAIYVFLSLVFGMPLAFLHYEPAITGLSADTMT